MIKSTDFLLVKPYCFDEQITEIDEQNISDGSALLSPLVVTICKSEVKYYLGDKDPKKLAQRLPLIFGHEAACRVVSTGAKSKFQPGERVIVVPLNPCGQCLACQNGKVNFCTQAKFMGSTAPGAMRTYFIYPEELMIGIPANIEPEIAALTEPLTIGYRAVIDAGIKSTARVAVVGAGTMGHILTLAISYFAKVPPSQLFIFDIQSVTLQYVKQIATPINIHTHHEEYRHQKGSFDFTFEVVGSQGSAQEAYELARPEGRIGILGLMDGLVTIFHSNSDDTSLLPETSLTIPNLTNFVNIGDQGILMGRQIRGFSRSRLEDYHVILNALTNNPSLYEQVEKLINPSHFNIRRASDLKEAFEFTRFRRDRKVCLHF